ncbi:MAG: alpha/beta hydrolase [Oleiphilaceae bacterium]|nr:alpha/beta hydrolase [Oleiphilaceae bacterium]
MAPLFFIHGMLSSARIWDDFRDYFQGLGYRCHAPSLPQHFTANQASDVAGLSLKDYRHSLESAYRQLDEAPVLIGHSMGALLAQQLASQKRPKAMILLAPAPSAGVTLFHQDACRTLLKPLSTPMYWRKGFKPSLSAASFGLFNGIPQEQHAHLYDQLCYESGKSLFEIAMWYLDRNQEARVDAELIDCPVLTLVGDEDRLTSVSSCKRISEQFSGTSHFHSLSGAGHWLPKAANWQSIARQIHVWLCWQQGLQPRLIDAQAGCS